MFNCDIRTLLLSGKTGIPAKTRTPSHNTRTLLKPVPYGRGYMDRAGPGTGTLGKPVPDPCHALPGTCSVSQGRAGVLLLPRAIALYCTLFSLVIF